MTFKAAKCPNCAGDIQVPDDRDSVKCMYCGSDIIVREAIKAAADGVNVENLIMLAKNAEEGANWSDANGYYTKILEYDSNNINAWIGRGMSLLSIKFLPLTHDANYARRTIRTDVTIDKPYDGGEYVPVDRLVQVFKRAIENPVISSSDIKMVENCFKKALELDSDSENKIIKTALTNRIIQICSKYFIDKTIYDYQIFVMCQPVLSIIYCFDQNNVLGLISKALVADIGLEAQLFFYKKALDISNNEEKVVKLISNLCCLVNSPLQFRYLKPYINNIKPVIDFLHEIVPNDRPMEKMILNGMNDNKKDPCFDFDRKIFSDLLREIKRIDPAYNMGEIIAELRPKSGCFIATAAYGSPMASEVILLRQFRDIYLESRLLGKAFIKAYYKSSPPIAGIISRSELLRAITRQILKPIIMMVKKVYLR